MLLDFGEEFVHFGENLHTLARQDWTRVVPLHTLILSNEA